MFLRVKTALEETTYASETLKHFVTIMPIVPMERRGGVASIRNLGSKGENVYIRTYVSKGNLCVMREEGGGR